MIIKQRANIIWIVTLSHKRNANHSLLSSQKQIINIFASRRFLISHFQIHLCAKARSHCPSASVTFGIWEYPQRQFETVVFQSLSNWIVFRHIMRNYDTALGYMENRKTTNIFTIIRNFTVCERIHFLSTLSNIPKEYTSKFHLDLIIWNSCSEIDLNLIKTSVTTFLKVVAAPCEHSNRAFRFLTEINSPLKLQQRIQKYTAQSR